MTRLVVESTPDLGPLEVSVYGPSGEAAEFVLSSGKSVESVAAEPGRYAIVARRPNGSKISQSVVVGDRDETVHLAAAVGASPNEFMVDETRRGQVALDPSAPRTSPWRGTMEGLAGTVLSAAATIAAPLASTLEIAGVPKDLVAFATLRAKRRQRRLSLHLWQLQDGAWEAADAADAVTAGEVSSEFLKICVQSGGPILALGLLDEDGFGPIVNVPPFAEPVWITFLAKSLLVRAADRNATPAGQRVPAALVTPVNRAAADMLSALAAPATAQAQPIWDQSLPELSRDLPIQLLMEKFIRPAEALIAAHFLLRFLPSKLPLRWADNLERAMPDAADGPVIAVWARILNPPADADGEALDAVIEEKIETALARPVTLFARTRALMFDALRLVSEPLADFGYEFETAYRRAGAEAGGLESFWGGSPAAPGKAAPRQAGTAVATVSFEKGAFNAMPAGHGQRLDLQGADVVTM